jgi:hypothetical protein
MYTYHIHIIYILYILFTYYILILYAFYFHFINSYACNELFYHIQFMYSDIPLILFFSVGVASCNHCPLLHLPISPRGEVRWSIWHGSLDGFAHATWENMSFYLWIGSEWFTVSISISLYIYIYILFIGIFIKIYVSINISNNLSIYLSV